MDREYRPKLMNRQKFFLMSSSFVTAIFNTVALLYIARNLGSGVLGALGFVLSFIGIVAFLGDMGYAHAFTRALDKGYPFSRCYSAYRVAKLKFTMLLVVAGAVLIAVYQYILGPHPYVHPMTLVAILAYYVCVNMAQIWITGLVARGKKRTPRVFDLTEAFVKAFMIIGMIQLGLAVGGSTGVFWLTFIYLTAAIFGLMIVLMSGKKLKARPADDEIILELQDTAAKILPFAAFIVMILHIDKIVIWKTMGIRDVGYYFGAQRIVIFIAASSGAIAAILAGALVRFKDDNEKMGDCLRMTERYITLMAVPVTVFYVMFAGDLLTRLLGTGFGAATEATMMLAVSSLFIALASPYLSYLLEANDYYHLGLISGIAFAVNLALVIILIPEYWLVPGVTWIHGLNGAAIAVLVSSLIAYFGYRASVLKKVSFKTNPRVLLHLLSSGVMAFVLKFMIWYFQIDITWYWILLFSLVGVFVYGIMIYLTGEYLKKDFERFKSLVTE